MADNTPAPKRTLTDEGIIDIPGLASRWVRLADGRKAHYVTAGDKGPAVILLHGGIEGSSGTAGWRFMAPYLAANGFRVYCPDRPGYGLSDTSKVEYLDASMKANNDFLLMFADALCIDKFHMSGNSMGCNVSTNFVVSHPERVLSVMFIAGALGDITEAPRVMGPQGKFTPNPSYVMKPWDGTAEGMQELMDGIIYERKAVWPELVEMRVRAGLNQRKPRDAAKLPYALDQVRSQKDPNQIQIFSTKGRIDKLTIPMIYLFGLQDVLAPVENGFNQEDSVPNIQFFYPDECGHQGQSDQPEIFNDVALEFFKTGKVTWATAVKAGVSLRKPINPRYVEEPKGGFPKPAREIYADPQSLRNGLKALDKVPA
ncbi:MAG: alpha/beta hydrolase [Phenylobacterium sp.]|uniref:alpha/beta fold hydrolase n=1 Tax=Phenylobacterium sp. TaxID=1871053 RepID=UPI002735D1FC|nr:alpha/beta hydrolase [Phenylobacterium sp.]MDP3173495.1 alpha/beta hydrolase [Phenylobacterium sp.]